MSKIVLQKDLPLDLTKLLAILCLQLQAEFDISQELLNKMLNNSEYIENCLFLYRQHHHMMILQVNEFKEKYVPFLDNSHGRNKKNYQPNEWEYEKCGHLKQVYPNGYVEYCNCHKYLHPHPDLHDYSSEIDHQFVVKKKEQIIRENYHYSIYIIYQNYVNHLYFMIRQLFHHMIGQSCRITPLQVELTLLEDDTGVVIRNSIELDQILEKMKHNSSIFKSKVLYEHLEHRQPTDQQKDNDTVEQNSEKSSYYLKIYTVIDTY